VQSGVSAGEGRAGLHHLTKDEEDIWDVWTMCQDMRLPRASINKLLQLQAGMAARRGVGCALPKDSRTLHKRAQQVQDKRLAKDFDISGAPESMIREFHIELSDCCLEGRDSIPPNSTLGRIGRISCRCV
jgi:hypothetical protein